MNKTPQQVICEVTGHNSSDRTQRILVSEVVNICQNYGSQFERHIQQLQIQVTASERTIEELNVTIRSLRMQLKDLE